MGIINTISTLAKDYTLAEAMQVVGARIAAHFNKQTGPDAIVEGYTQRYLGLNPAQIKNLLERGHDSVFHSLHLTYLEDAVRAYERGPFFGEMREKLESQMHGTRHALHLAFYSRAKNRIDDHIMARYGIDDAWSRDVRDTVSPHGIAIADHAMLGDKIYPWRDFRNAVNAAFNPEAAADAAMPAIIADMEKSGLIPGAQIVSHFGLTDTWADPAFLNDVIRRVAAGEAVLPHGPGLTKKDLPFEPVTGARPAMIPGRFYTADMLSDVTGARPRTLAM